MKNDPFVCDAETYEDYLVWKRAQNADPWTDEGLHDKLAHLLGRNWRKRVLGALAVSRKDRGKPGKPVLVHSDTWDKQSKPKKKSLPRVKLQKRHHRTGHVYDPYCPRPFIYRDRK